MEITVTPLRLVLCGDGAVGKTSLLMSYCHQTVPAIYKPTVFDHAKKYVFLDSRPTAVAVTFCDTSTGVSSMHMF